MLCKLCEVYHSSELVDLCSCVYPSLHRVRKEKYSVWMQLQYESFGSFYNGFHDENICTDKCIICADNNTENIGYCFFPRIIDKIDYNYNHYREKLLVTYSPLKVIMCGQCYIKYNTSKIGKEITVVSCDEDAGWQIAAIQLFRQYVYDLHYKCEGVMLCINYCNGFDGDGRKILLPNEILLMIFNYAWKDCYFEFRRDSECERNVEKEIRRWREI